MKYFDSSFCSSNLVGLVVDQGGEVSLVAGELHQDELVAVLPRKGKQKLKQSKLLSGNKPLLQLSDELQSQMS